MPEQDIVRRLRIKADIITMGEKIEWGSETVLMKEAADEIERQDREIKAILKSVLFHFGPEWAGKVTKDALAARDG